MIAKQQLFATILQANNYSLTKPRQAVFDALSRNQAISMAQLVSEVSDICDRASVYRIVKLFEQLNIVTRLPLGWKYQLELSDLFREHHHHATCTHCHKIIDFKETQILMNELETIAQKIGFSVTDHSLELQGLCQDCRS